MSNLNQIVPFTFGTHQLRTVKIDDEPYFLAMDICNTLDLSDTNMALKKLDGDEKLTQTLLVSGQNRKVWIVNESGLYNLIFRSNKPEAKQFRKWVTSEVLPSIRRTGRYERPVDFQSVDSIDLNGVKYYDFYQLMKSIGIHYLPSKVKNIKQGYGGAMVNFEDTTMVTKEAFKVILKRHQAATTMKEKHNFETYLLSSKVV